MGAPNFRKQKMIKIINEFEISISGKIFPLEFDCAFGPWTPECYCEINDFKLETGSDLPDGIVIVADLKRAGKKIPFDFVNIQKETDSNKIVMTYEIDPDNMDRANVFKEFEIGLGNSGMIISEIFFPYWITEYKPVLVSKKDSNENIHQSILTDIELMRSVKKNKNMASRIFNMRIFNHETSC
jgi:hypothetical protein